MAAQRDLAPKVIAVWKAKDSFMAVSSGDLLVELPDEKLHVVKKDISSMLSITKRALGPALTKKTYLPCITLYKSVER